MSVPSFFSQLYEQAEAFSNIVYNYPNGNPSPDSVEKRLVSLCLDLFELILMRGSEVSVAHIDLGDIQQLSQSSNPNHQLLASIITEDLQYLSYRNISDWYLFGWHNVVLGGTSPKTMVYTSPNIISEFEERNLDIRGFCGNRLFRDIVPLHQRGYQFKEFMYEYKDSFPLPTPLREYIDRSMQIDHVVLHLKPIGITSKYDVLTDSYGNPIYVNDIPILHIPIRVEESDYMIIPHKNVTGNLPLVLSEQGLPGARYVLGMQWNRLIIGIPHVSLEERILPGTIFRYPFITIDDLIEPRIIQVQNRIDSARFITCSLGDSDYLLPIRRMYFEYFTLEDLRNNFSVEAGDTIDSVRVSLKIPVRGGVFEFHRVYHSEDIVNLNINIAVTPVYHLEGETYHLLCLKERNTELHIGNTNSTDIDTGVTYTTRYHDDKREIGGYTIHDPWDYIAVCFNDSVVNGSLTGLVVPILRNSGLLQNNCVFSVDMSDSYTTIMHKKEHELVAQPLIIDEQIIGVLCPEDAEFKSQINRYFIGVSDSNRQYSPFKNLLNVTYDMRLNPQSGKFLENYNIALDYDVFSRRGNENIVRLSLHNLNLNHHSDIENLRTYFEGLLFIMKQEAMKQYNSPTFDLRIAVPPYLNAAEKDLLKHILIQAHYASGTNYCNDTMFISSPAAIVLSTHFTIAHPGDFVNIHIDSMHTYITHCDNDGRVRTVCVDMGIGDLFQNVHRFYGNDGPFVSRVIHQYLFAAYSPDELQIIDSHIQYDHWTLFDVLENDKDYYHCGQLEVCVKEVVTVYLIGLFYYLGRYLGEMNLGQPHTVVFSGLGSKYLKLCFREERSLECLFDSVIHLVQEDNYETKNTRMLFYAYPTEIISKGLHIDGMFVKETLDVFYGLDECINEPVRLREILEMNVRDNMYNTFRHFIDVLRSDEIRDVLCRELDYGSSITLNNINDFVYMAMKSVNMCIDESMNINGPEGKCDEALFFWSLKHSLYELLKNNC